MIFLDPTNDVAFKKLFGNMAYPDIIISFLNSILERKEGKKIIEALINDHNNLPENDRQKTSIVHVRCTDQAGNQYIIEMQVAPQSYFATRALYYSAVAFSRQLGKSERFDIAVPVIFVGILGFNLFKNDNNYLSHNLILDTKTGEQKCKGFEFHFVELKKFTKKLEELETLAEKWIYFLSDAHEQNKVPNNLTELEEAFFVLNKNSWTFKELDEYERILNSIRLQNDTMDTAEKKSREEGREKGKEEEKINIAKKMLKKFDVETVAENTGLDIEVVKTLKSEL